MSNAFTHVGDFGVKDHRHARGTGKPVVVILDGLERLRLRARAQHHHDAGRGVHLVDRLHPVRELLTGECVAAFAHEDLVAQQRLATESFVTHGADAFQPVLVEFVGLGAVLGRVAVDQLVVVAFVADVGRRDRAHLEVFLPIVLIQRIEFRCLVDNGFGGRCWCDGACVRALRWCAGTHREGQCNDEWSYEAVRGHEWSPVGAIRR